MYEHFPIAMWLIDGSFWSVGLFFWILTYIVAPLAAKKRGHSVSGTPGIAFLCFLTADLLSPIKWLAWLSLLDFSVIWFIFIILRGDFRKKQ